jgi:hypothetical protein
MIFVVDSVFLSWTSTSAIRGKNEENVNNYHDANKIYPENYFFLIQSLKNSLLNHIAQLHNSTQAILNQVSQKRKYCTFIISQMHPWKISMTYDTFDGW